MGASWLASDASRVAVLPVCSHYPRRRLCSLAVLARCAVRHASWLASTASRVAVLHFLQSLSSASALLRRRARSKRFAPCLVAGVNRFSRCSAALPAVTILGVGFAPSPCSLDALCAMLRCWRQPLLALQCCPCAVT